MPASLESVNARSNEVAPECDADGVSADGSVRLRVWGVGLRVWCVGFKMWGVGFRL